MLKADSHEKNLSCQLVLLQKCRQYASSIKCSATDVCLQSPNHNALPSHLWSATVAVPLARLLWAVKRKLREKAHPATMTVGNRQWRLEREDSRSLEKVRVKERRRKLESAWSRWIEWGALVKAGTESRTVAKMAASGNAMSNGQWTLANTGKVGLNKPTPIEGWIRTQN